MLDESRTCSTVEIVNGYTCIYVLYINTMIKTKYIHIVISQREIQIVTQV